MGGPSSCAVTDVTVESFKDFLHSFCNFCVFSTLYRLWIWLDARHVWSVVRSFLTRNALTGAPPDRCPRYAKSEVLSELAALDDDAADYQAFLQELKARP